jgi:serine/threonine protein kinase
VSKAKLANVNGRTKTMIKDVLVKDSTPKNKKIRITMPPEMKMKGDEDYGYSVDWYALGIVIYHMLTGGEHPFRELN